jgi:hypothetical protein
LPDRSPSTTATLARNRSRLIETERILTDADGEAIATSSGKYVPLGSPDETRAFLQTLIADRATQSAIDLLHA